LFVLNKIEGFAIWYKILEKPQDDHPEAYFYSE